MRARESTHRLFFTEAGLLKAYFFFFNRSLWTFITKTIIDDTVVMRFVIISGQLLIMNPWMTKNILPNPSRRNVGIAMPSVSRVRMVYMACGR